MKDQFLRIDVVAERLDVSSETVRKWIKNRRFRVYKFGGAIRINMKDIMKFAEIQPGIDELRKSVLKEE